MLPREKLILSPTKVSKLDQLTSRHHVMVPASPSTSIAAESVSPAGPSESLTRAIHGLDRPRVPI